MRKLYTHFIRLSVIICLSGSKLSVNAQRIIPYNVQDSLALVDLYNSTNGPNWAVKWNLSQPVSTWYGISPSTSCTCDIEKRVRQLSLVTENLNGTIPASLANLTELVNLDLSHNSLHGEIPASLSTLPKLEHFVLSYNQLTGQIPTSFVNLTTLTIANFSYNLLSGAIPVGLLRLPNLGSLQLYNNLFNFDGLEPLYRVQTAVLIGSSGQGDLTVNNKNGILSVHAGGTLALNTYTWKVDNNPTGIVIVGDSTFNPPTQGTWYVTVKNSIVPASSSLTGNPFYLNKLIVYKFNPNPGYINAQGQVSAGTGILETNIAGAATDGVTKIVLTTKSSVPITFSVTDSVDGTFSDMAAQTIHSTSLLVQPHSNMVTVIYNSPDGYGTLGAKGGRHAVIDATDSYGNNDTIHLTLLTPPVVLVHGMWSSSSVWTDGDFTKRLKANGISGISLPDYSPYSANTYNINSSESIYGRSAVRNAVNSAIIHYAKDLHIAVCQADVVGHSMGGLMSRSYSQESNFVVRDNYYKGYIHKLITIGTPHRGTPLGPVLWNAKDNIIFLRTGNPVIPSIPFKLSLIALMVDMPIGSCHRDFGIESAGVQSLATTLPYKTYAIIGDYFPLRILDYLALNYVTSTVLHQSLASIFASRCDLNQPLASDIIVPTSSQRGYINHDTTFINTSHSVILPFPYQSETTSTEIQDKVSRLLLSNNANEFSNGFPAPSAQPLDCNTTSLRVTENSAVAQQPVLSGAQQKYIRLTTPLSNAVYVAGQSNQLTLSFEPGGGMVPDTTVFMIEGLGNYGISGNERSASITLPANIPAGSFHVLVLSSDANGNVYADTSHILLSVASALDSISATPDAVLLDASFPATTVTVYGYYKKPDSAYIINITQSLAGTSYKAQKNGAVFTVSANGLLTAVASGQDTLEITNGTRKTKIAVTVADGYTSSPLANAINFPVIPDQPLSDVLMPLTASAVSGEPVTFKLLSGPAEMYNGVLHLTGTGTITVQALSAGNAYFSNASSVNRSFNVTGALPVNLIDFTATRISGEKVTLNWKTGSEEHNKGFYIERKLQGAASFSQTAFVASLAINGNSSSMLAYSYNDQNNDAGTSYYRLKQTDEDGKISYSAVRTVNGNASNITTLQVWPNPAAGLVNIRMTGISGTQHAVLSDATGRQVRSINIYPGEVGQLNSLQAGVYLLHVSDASNAGKSYSVKVMVLP